MPGVRENPELSARAQTHKFLIALWRSLGPGLRARCSWPARGSRRRLRRRGGRDLCTWPRADGQTDGQTDGRTDRRESGGPKEEEDGAEADCCFYLVSSPATTRPAQTRSPPPVATPTTATDWLAPLRSGKISLFKRVHGTMAPWTTTTTAALPPPPPKTTTCVAPVLLRHHWPAKGPAEGNSPNGDDEEFEFRGAIRGQARSHQARAACKRSMRMRANVDASARSQGDGAPTSPSAASATRPQSRRP